MTVEGTLADDRNRALRRLDELAEEPVLSPQELQLIEVHRGEVASCTGSDGGCCSVWCPVRHWTLELKPLSSREGSHDVHLRVDVEDPCPPNRLGDWLSDMRRALDEVTWDRRLWGDRVGTWVSRLLAQWDADLQAFRLSIAIMARGLEPPEEHLRLANPWYDALDRGSAISHPLEVMVHGMELGPPKDINVEALTFLDDVCDEICDLPPLAALAVTAQAARLMTISGRLHGELMEKLREFRTLQ